MTYVVTDYLTAWWGYRRRHYNASGISSENYNDTNSEGNRFITNDDL